MDSGIADCINRRNAQTMAHFLDQRDQQRACPEPWHGRPLADVLMGDDSDRAWFVGAIAAMTRAFDVPYVPADCDWDNLFSHFRAEILARRDRKSPPAPGVPPVRDGVRSR